MQKRPVPAKEILMSMARRNVIAGAALIAFACWYAYLAGSLPSRDIMPNTPGPAFFPTIIVCAVLLLSVALLATGIIALRKESSEEPGKTKAGQGAWAVAAFATYLATLPYAGFIAASIPFFAVLMYLYGTRNRLMLGAVSVGMPVALYIVFRFGFQIVLPRGLIAF